MDLTNIAKKKKKLYGNVILNLIFALLIHNTKYCVSVFESICI